MNAVKFLIPLLVLALVTGSVALIQARIVRVESAEVFLKDLPASLDGIRIAYVSDIHISNEMDIRRTKRLMDQLQTAQPDLLLLGGDYSDMRMWRGWSTLGNEDKKQRLYQNRVKLSHQWMETLQEFSAPMGKFAVEGNHDINDANLAAAMAAGGVRLLENESVAVERNGARLIIAGVKDYTVGDYRPSGAARGIRAEDCCILLSHNPDALPQMFTMHAETGGAWVDLALAGHTHGGQVRFGKWIPIINSDYGTTYLSGWHEQPSGYSLTSNGVGTTGWPVRLGVPAQAHIITLRAAE